MDYEKKKKSNGFHFSVTLKGKSSSEAGKVQLSELAGKTIVQIGSSASSLHMETEGTTGLTRLLSC